MRHWRPFGLGVVRAAGFGFDLVDGLAEPDLYHTARRWSEVRRELDQAAAAFRAAAAAAPRITVSEQMRAARRGIRRIDRRQPLAPGDPVPDRIADHPGGHEFRDWWNARCEESVRLAGQARHAYAAGLRSARGHLDSSLREPRVRAALTLLTPEILETAVRALLRRPPQAPAPNQAERKAVAFLQRLAAKCETNGIAGPIGYATLGPPQVPVPAASGHRGFVAFWAVVALVRQALRRWADGGAPLRVGSAAAHLPPGSPAARLLPEVVAGDRKLPLERLWGLHERDLLWFRDWTVPVAEPDALATLRRIAAGTGAPEFVAAAARLTDLAAAFAEGTAEEKVAALAAADGLLTEWGVGGLRRGGGELYADRVALYQESYDHSLSLRLPERAGAKLVTRLAPALDLAATAGVQAWRSAAAAFTEAWDRAYPDRRRRPLPQVLRTLPTQFPMPVTDTPVARALTALVDARWDRHCRQVTLSAGDLAGLPADVDPAPPVLLSPDLHFDSSDPARVRDGDAPVVLGELHWGLQALGNLCVLLPDRAALRDAFRAWIGGSAPELVHVATRDRYGKLCYLELMPRTVEFGGPAAEGQHRLGLGDLDAGADGAVWERRTGERVALLLGDAQGTQQSPLGVPSAAWPVVDLGAFTPRLLVGDVVVQRAAWRIAAGELPGHGSAGVDRYLATVAGLSALGVPRRCFATVAGERKPIFLDLASPHLVDLLHSEAKGRAVRLTEMLPAPAGLWQRLGERKRVCELRLTVTGSLPDRPVSAEEGEDGR